MIWLLIGYMWLFIHRPFEVWPWMAAYRPERVFMILTIICWSISAPKLPRWNRLHGYFALFVLAMIASMLLSPYQAASLRTTQDYLKLVVFYILVVTTARDGRSLRVLLLGFVFAMTLFVAHSLREFYLGRAFYLQGISRLRSVNVTFGDQNYFSGLIVMSLPFAYVFWRGWSGRLKRSAVLGYVSLSVWCIIKSGSRMGFCGLLLGICLAVLTSPTRWRLLALAPLVLIGAWMFLPEANQDRYLSLIRNSSEDSRASDVKDYRYWGFRWGLELCAQRPLLGHGPGATRLAHSSGRPGHNTYGEVLGELGLVGTVAFGLIFLGVAQNFLEARRIVRRYDLRGDLFAWHAVAATSAAFLLTAFVSWGLHFLWYFVWLWFGAFQAVALHCLKEQADASEEAEAFSLANESSQPALT